MNSHAYRLQILKDGRIPAGDPVALTLCGPLQRGVEALRWSAFVEGVHPVPGPIRITPRWSSEVGEPAVTSLNIEAGGRSLDLPASRLFAQAAARESSRLVDAGVLAAGQAYSFLVTAEQSPSATCPQVFQLDDYPVMPGAATTAGEPVDSEFSKVDFPVHISREVLADAINLAEHAGDAETGGVLFGRLVREPIGGPPLLQVTHLCPAEEGRGAVASFTFTPETWSRAQIALTERAAGEIMVGSYHSHPDFCAKCEPEKQQVCALRRPFFSLDDVRLHEAIFPAAFSVGLLASHDGTRFIPSLWGWRDGFITRRSYLLTNS